MPSQICYQFSFKPNWRSTNYQWEALTHASRLQCMENLKLRAEWKASSKHYITSLVLSRHTFPAHLHNFEHFHSCISGSNAGRVCFLWGSDTVLPGNWTYKPSSLPTILHGCPKAFSETERLQKRLNTWEGIRRFNKLKPDFDFS